MSKTIKSKAAQAVLRGRGWKPGQKIPAHERGVVRQDIRWAAESPVFRHLEEKTRPELPSPEEQERIRNLYALKYLARDRRSRVPGRPRRVEDPEMRRSLMEQARDLSRTPHVDKYTKKKKYTFTPRSLGEKLDTAELLRGRNVLVLVDGTWMEADKVAGRRDSDYNKPYVIAVGMGFSATVLLVWAHSDDEAVEVAEDRWPHLLFGETLRKGQEPPPEEEEEWTWIDSLGKWGKREEDIRFFKVAEDVSQAKSLGSGRLYRLTDGRVVEVAG